MGAKYYSERTIIGWFFFGAKYYSKRTIIGMRAQGFNPKTRGRESGEGIVQWFKILALSHRPLF